MSRTKAEVRAFLNSQVGLMVNKKCGIYNGQCVSLIKALLEFLGAPDPYAARGNAKDVGDTLLRQGIAKNGSGWLNVCVNRSMGNIGGVNYGHIWLDLSNEANYEQNGARALHTTKNTRPISQAQQIINLDQYIKSEEKKVMNTKQSVYVAYRFYLGRDPSEAEYNANVGKTTFDTLSISIRDSAAYKQEIKNLEGVSKGVKQIVRNHLPGQLRNA